MSTTTRLVAGMMIAASFGAVLATGGTALFDGAAPASDNARSEAAFAQVQATIRTDWLAPVSARRSLEQRSDALERWVAERGGYVRVLDTASLLRTRDATGARLPIPLAQIERTLIIGVPEQRQAPQLEQALAGLDATIAAITFDTEAFDTEAITPRAEF